MFEKLEHPIVLDCIEKRLDVSVEHPIHLARMQSDPEGI
jgi:hypothetical protein